LPRVYHLAPRDPATVCQSDDRKRFRCPASGRADDLRIGRRSSGLLPQVLCQHVPARSV